MPLMKTKICCTSQTLITQTSEAISWVWVLLQTRVQNKHLRARKTLPIQMNTLHDSKLWSRTSKKFLIHIYLIKKLFQCLNLRCTAQWKVLWEIFMLLLSCGGRNEFNLRAIATPKILLAIKRVAKLVLAFNWGKKTFLKHSHGSRLLS